MKHEEYIQRVRSIVVQHITDADTRTRLESAKLVYGIGDGRYRGICYYGAWEQGHKCELVEVAASGEESPIQLAGTTIHELGHVLAGMGKGHGGDWKVACGALGLTVTSAGGQHYELTHFADHIRADIEALSYSDGQPVFGSKSSVYSAGLHVAKLKPCPLGIGTRGGTSRGTGSGSRMRKYVCQCSRPVRVASDTFNATCNDCHTVFTRAEDTASNAASNAA